jgi:predicted Zn-dependent protease
MNTLEQYDYFIDLYRNGKISEAISGLQDLTKSAPEFALSYNALAAFAKKNGNLEEAIKHAETYCKLTPHDPFGFTILSAYYFEAGDRPKAENAISESYAIRFKQQQKI